MPISYSEKRLLDSRRTEPGRRPVTAPDLGCDRVVLERLQSRIGGRVILPGFPDYELDRQLSNPLFQAYPQVIVYCRDGASDVAAALEAADACGLPVRLRSGGHSTAGFSTGPGMIVDTGDMNSAHVTTMPQPRVAVGPGCNFGRLNDVLGIYGLHVPGGGCPDVCPAGYMQGGGFGFTSRIFGMNCDSVAGVQMVLADGRTVRADAAQNPDLYWAVRGGTGNNFGVLTEITYGLQEIPAGEHEVPMVWGFALRWPLSTPMQIRAAAKALELMQAEYMAEPGKDRVGYMTIVCTQTDSDGQNRAPYLMMRGMVVPPGEGAPEHCISDLMRTGAELQYAEWDTYNRLNHKLLTEPAEIPDFPPGTKMPMEDKHARYVEKTLSVSDWTAILEHVVYRTPNDYSCLVIEPYGGAINAVGPLHTAFVHRKASFNIFLDGFWWNETERPAVEAFLKEWTDLIAPHWNRHVYQNYPHVDLPDYRWNYWGDAFPTLLKVKQKYDPHEFFDFPQAIKPLPSETSGLTVSTAEPRFSESRIAYGDG